MDAHIKATVYNSDSLINNIDEECNQFVYEEIKMYLPRKIL